MNSKKQKQKQKGFTLLELMLAIAIFIVGTASVAHLYIGAQTSASYSVDKLQATLLAKEGIEAARHIRDSQGFDSLSSYGGTETITLDQKDYVRDVTISCGTESCEVNSSVEWEPIQGRGLETVSFTAHLTSWMDGEFVGGE